jgi:transcription elongation factor Elf1
VLQRLSVRCQSAYSAKMRSSQSAVAFSCPHCGARYVVSYTELPIADSGSNYCECCKRRMVQWNSALQPRYKLVERPDRTNPNA